MKVRRLNNRGSKDLTLSGELLDNPTITAEGDFFFKVAGEAATESFIVLLPWAEIERALLRVPAQEAAARLGGGAEGLAKYVDAIRTIAKGSQRTKPEDAYKEIEEALGEKWRELFLNEFCSQFPDWKTAGRELRVSNALPHLAHRDEAQVWIQEMFDKHKEEVNGEFVRWAAAFRAMLYVCGRAVPAFKSVQRLVKASKE